MGQQALQDKSSGDGGNSGVALHTRRNFRMFILDCSFAMMGMAFMDPVAVLPVLMVKLHASPAAIGLIGGLLRTGGLLPQLFSASVVLHRERKWPYVFYTCLLGRLCFPVVAVVFFLPGAAHHPQKLLLLLFAAFTILSFSNGFASVSWLDIIARSIPTTLRGRLFGAMQFFSGLLAVGAGLVVVRVLADTTRPFPSNYGLLFVLMSCCLALSTLCLGLIREPKNAVVSEPQPFLEILRAIPSTLRTYPRLFRGILAQNLCGLVWLAAPFYVLYATQQLALPISQIGLFVIAGVVGSAGTSVFWGFLCDRFGSTQVIRGVALAVVLIPTTALLTPVIGAALGLGKPALGFLYALVFLLNGASTGSISNCRYCFKKGRPKKRLSHFPEVSISFLSPSPPPTPRPEK